MPFIYFVDVAVNATPFAPPDLDRFRELFLHRTLKFNPEPAERLRYILHSLLFPLLCIPLFLLLRKRALGALEKKGLVGTLYVPFALAVSLLLPAAVGLTMVSRAAFYLRYGAAFYGLLVLFPLVLAALLAEKRAASNKRASIALDVACGFSLLFMFVIIFHRFYFDAWDPRATSHNFVTYFNSVVSTYLGKTIFVDFLAQYGAYSIMLLPVLKITGLSVGKFTLLMAAMTCSALLGLFLLLRETARSRIIALIGTASVVWFNYLIYELRYPRIVITQQLPGRFFFPALLPLVAWLYLKSERRNRGRRMYLSACLFCSLAVAWSPETGVVVCLSWLAFLFFGELFDGGGGAPPPPAFA